MTKRNHELLRDVRNELCVTPIYTAAFARCGISIKTLWRHIQDLRRRRYPGHDREPTPPGARYSRHRLQDRRRDRHEAWNGEDRDGTGPPRYPQCATEAMAAGHCPDR